MKNSIGKIALFFLCLAFMHTSGLTQGIVTTNGSKLILNNGVKLVINNAGIVIDGYITPDDGSLYFTGSASTAASFLSGNDPVSIRHLVLNKSSNGMLLNQHLNIGNSIEFISGDSLFLNGFNIDLGSSGSLINERGASRITGATGGYIKVTSILNGLGYQNPGNIGLAISSLSNLGITVIKRYPQQHSGLSISRHFDITPTINLALNASVRFYYFHEELSGNLESSLGIFESFDNGTNWTNLGTDATNYTTNYIEKDGLFSLDHLTLSDASVALATKLLSFQGRNEMGWNILEWQTAGESNPTVYHLERSFNGKDFMETGIVAGKGALRNTYTYRDLTPAYATSFYRIKTVESVNTHYSSIVKIERPNTAQQQTGWYPNPAANFSMISLNSLKEETLLLQLCDAGGKIQHIQQVNLKPGVNNIKLDLNRLPNGVYFLYAPSLLKQTGPLFIQR